jgi:hypothetical protein
MRVDNRLRVDNRRNAGIGNGTYRFDAADRSIVIFRRHGAVG